jgi:uncharacterized repeat protein (TIGR01451 family)
MTAHGVRVSCLLILTLCLSLPAPFAWADAPANDSPTSPESSTAGAPAAADDDALTVDGIVETDYQFVGRVDLGGSGGVDADAPGNLFQAEANGVCYYAFVVDRTYNDNVYGSDSAYLLLDGWEAHHFHHLEGSDRADFELVDAAQTTLGYVSLDYLYESAGQWLSGPDGNNVNTGLSPLLPVLESSSSQVYNLNNVSWPDKLNQSPPYDYNDTNSPRWQWHMVYEFSISAAEFGLGGACAEIDEAGAHNSPYKEQGSTALGRLGDEVWQDLDGDGVRDADGAGVPTEPGFEEARVKLYAGLPNLDGSCDPTGVDPVRVTQTDPAGYYGFENLSAGDYCVEMDESSLPPAVWSLTTPPEPRFVSLANGQEDNSVDFGYLELVPSIAIAKTPDAQTVRSGSDVTFTIVITNTGEAPLGDVSVGDALAPDCDRSLGSLDVEQSTSYTCTAVNAMADFTNTATVTGTPSRGEPVSDTDTAEVRVVSPAIAIGKTADPTLVATGGIVTYTYAVTNPGDDPLSDVVVTDDTCSPVSFASGDEDGDALVDVGETWIYTCSMALTQDTTNTATATGRDSTEGTVSDTDTAFVDVVRIGLDIEASGPAQAHEGDRLTYEIIMTNTSELPLDITVPLPDGSDWIGTLQPDETTTFTTTDTVPVAADDPYVATFTATGASAVDREATDSASVTTDILHPAIEAAVTPSIGQTYGSLPVTVTFAATNVGDTPLYDVTITSDNGTPDDPSDDHPVCSATDLAVGDMMTCDEVVILSEDTTYVGIAAGHDVLDGATEDQAETTITIIPSSEEEDTDGDGIPDYLDSDADGDGIPNAVEGSGDADNDGLPNYLDTDSDGDGIPDIVEGTGDPDDDGLPNFLDADSDGDGIPDAVEGTGDPDDDGLPNFLDADSDGDGIPDAVEGTGDPDDDGLPNFLDADSDGDGIPDAVEGTGDPDDDGLPNFLDADSDGDGIPDAVEGTGDPDSDELPNFLDLDSDGDGIPDAIEGTEDTDEDGIPNYLDLDSDGDGKPDSEEGTEDVDEDGIMNFVDSCDMGHRIYLPLILG